MLAESEAITERSQWKKIKSLFSSDPRYKAVDSDQREEYFEEHVKSLGGRVSGLIFWNCGGQGEGRHQERHLHFSFGEVIANIFLWLGVVT